MSEMQLEQVMAIESRASAFGWSIGNFQDCLRAQYGAWVVCAGARVVGYAVLRLAADEAELLNIGVDAAYRRRGIARLLMRHLLAIACAARTRQVLLEVRASNAPAQALYARFGFVQIGRRRDYYRAHDGREDALVLALTLKDH
ncbi:ribosomal protein S18-alanine N-acetyltransferase [Sinimarinibacterium sp. NLF-5-8]|nr:ribosomal protein S18-alanine N-acetyltransferase [Sinimarinibacterium sp. NLF-5-8]